MGSREKSNQMAPHQPLLSSLVVRPTDAGGGGGGGTGNDYERGEVRHGPPSYSRSDRNDGHGYRMRAGSVSPVHHRNARHCFSPGFEPSDAALRTRGLGNGRDPDRYRDYSLAYGRGRDGGRFAARGFDRSAPGPGSPRGEGLRRNNPNVQPRDGDWICSDPLCKNLNFARREHCNNCNRPRCGSSGSPRRGYLRPPFLPRQRIPSPLDHSPGGILNDTYRSRSRGWPKDGPRDYRPPGPLARREGRFLDPLVRGDRRVFPEDEPRNRYRLDRPILPDWDPRDCARDSYFSERRGGFGKRALSPPPATAVPQRGWTSHVRDRSRSPPVRGGVLPKEYPRGGGETYMSRGRNDRHGGVRDAF